ncbi:MAG: hypothetical protein Salg2KO_20850 [Salibacteraceae bacterium]
MRKLLFLIPFLIFGLINDSKACFDPDTTIVVIVNYDTIDSGGCAYASEVAIRISNLRVMNESPNKICACGFKNLDSTFSNINFLAFVDSGTNNPYNGIALFDSKLQASTAWDNSAGNGSWGGFIADVINGGLSATSPVEFIIRAKAAEGLVFIDSNCTGSATLEEQVNGLDFGTDAWDPILEDLDQSHQSIRELGEQQPVQMIQRNALFFSNLDGDILLNQPIDTNTPRAQFSFTEDNTLINFINESNNNALQYLIWDFGDGTPPVKSFGDVSHDYGTSRSVAYNACLYNINNDDTVDSACTEIIFGGIGSNRAFSSANRISTYPNPASDILRRTVDEALDISDIQLVSIVGQPVKAPFDAQTSSFDVSNVNAGMYFVTGKSENKQYSSEMVIITH